MKYIPIRKCSECPHHDHSGAFTEGGPWPVCHGPHDINDVNWKEINKSLNYNDPKAGEKWSPPILPTDEYRVYTDIIPDWCPL